MLDHRLLRWLQHQLADLAGIGNRLGKASLEVEGRGSFMS